MTHIPIGIHKPYTTTTTTTIQYHLHMTSSRDVTNTMTSWLRNACVTYRVYDGGISGGGGGGGGISGGGGGGISGGGGGGISGSGGGGISTAVVTTS